MASNQKHEKILLVCLEHDVRDGHCRHCDAHFEEVQGSAEVLWNVNEETALALNPKLRISKEHYLDCRKNHSTVVKIKQDVLGIGRGLFADVSKVSSYQRKIAVCGSVIDAA